MGRDRFTPFDRFDQPPEDYSQLGVFDPDLTVKQGLKLGAAYFTTQDDNARADILRKTLPGVVFERDPDGRIIASYNGKRGYINRPGFDMGDVVDFASNVVKFLPAGKAAGMGGSLLTRMGIAGAASGATSVAEDVAAGAQGSEQGIDPVKAGVSAAGGMAGEGLSGPVSRGVSWLGRQGVELWRRLVGSGQVQGGTLSAQGAAAARQLGLDPNQLTQELIDRLETAARDATRAGLPDEQVPAVAARVANASDFGVPLSKGQATADFAQQSVEENLAKMDVSTKAGNIIRGFRGQADDAFTGESGQTGFGLLRQRVAGNAPAVANATDAGQAVVAGTRQSADVARSAYRDAYRTARESGASMDVRAFKGWLETVDDAIKSQVDFDAALMPKTAQMLARLKGNSEWFGGMGREAPRVIPLAKLENTRKLINALWKSADDADKMGLNVLRGQFDDMVNAALDSGQVRGDAAAVQAWRSGRELYSRFQSLYGSAAPNAGQAEKAASTAVNNWLRSDSVMGEDVIRQAMNNPALARRIVQIHGVGSPQHQALKQGILEMVFRPAMKPNGVSPQLIVSQFDKFFRKGAREKMAGIFSPADLAQIARFEQVAASRIPQAGVVNYSNSGNVVVRAMQELGQRLGLLSGDIGTMAAVRGAQEVGERAAAGQAREAVRGLVPAVPRSALPAAAGAAAGEATLPKEN